MAPKYRMAAVKEAPVFHPSAEEFAEKGEASREAADACLAEERLRASRAPLRSLLS